MLYPSYRTGIDKACSYDILGWEKEHYPWLYVYHDVPILDRLSSYSLDCDCSIIDREELIRMYVLCVEYSTYIC